MRRPEPPHRCAPRCLQLSLRPCCTAAATGCGPEPELILVCDARSERVLLLVPVLRLQQRKGDPATLTPCQCSVTHTRRASRRRAGEKGRRCGRGGPQGNEEVRGKSYMLGLEEVSRRVAEAWERGAEEVCMQGGIHPDFTGDTYLRRGPDHPAHHLPSPPSCALAARLAGHGRPHR